MLPITGLYTALIIFLALVLTLRVIAVRRSHKISIGDGGIEMMTKRIRAHANLLETAPLFLVAFAVLELNGASPMWLYPLGTLFVLARILHALGLSQDGPSKFRFYGMLLTVIAMVIVAVYVLVQSLLL
ncbi:MAG: MAPEG family protein [Rhizobiaceae bacterium]